MRLFDVLGPVMIGPSSSHTAGAARIGYTAQKLLGEIPAQADIGLYGSFATTGKGHGTDRALVAGLLGLRPDDPRLPDSFALAAQRGMQFSIHPVELRSAHPNTAVLTLTSRTGRQLSLKVRRWAADASASRKLTAYRRISAVTATPSSSTTRTPPAALPR